MRERAADITDVAREIAAQPPGRRTAAARRTCRAARSSWPTSCLRSTRRAWTPGGCGRSRSSGAARRRTPRSSPAPSACRPSSGIAGSLRRRLARAAHRRGRRPRHRRDAPVEGTDPPEPRRASARGGRRAGACARRTAGAAATRDGVRIVVRANLELPEEIPALERYRAEGVGLFRSEFLYLRAAPAFPGRRGAARGLREPARGGGAASGRRAHLRSRRREGDRSGAGREPGARPARSALLPRPPGALRRAADGALPGVAAGDALDPAPDGDVALGAPRRARRSGDGSEARRALRGAAARGDGRGSVRGSPRRPARRREADFFSIGTNDLAQYALAVDRSNPDVSALYQPLHPSILRMIRIGRRRRAKPRDGRSRSAASSPPTRSGSRVLVGLGIRELSVTPVAIAGVKEPPRGHRFDPRAGSGREGSRRGGGVRGGKTFPERRP